MANSMKHLPLPLTRPLHLHPHLPSLLLLLLLAVLASCSVMVQGHVHGREIVVGGDQHWRFGLNYSAWAEKAGPFFVGDTLGKCPMASFISLAPTSLLDRRGYNVLVFFFFHSVLLRIVGLQRDPRQPQCVCSPQYEAIPIVSFR